jgi:hypothetical protein
MVQRKAIPSETKLRLFATSSGHCQRPECLTSLFPLELNGVRHIAEMAHVIPYSKAGPRSDEAPDEEFEPDLFENLLLLCPTCHTIIDKNPDAYPRNILLTWKNNHLSNLASKQGIKPYKSRIDARKTIVERLDENKAIWKKFAPIDGSEFAYDPESEVAEIWIQRIKSIILPNHFHTLSILKCNLHLMTELERQTNAEYKEHVRGLTNRHICGVAGSAIRFPQNMETIFE